MVGFADTGWRLFPQEQAVRDWVAAARPAALAALSDPALENWWRNEGTWFVGVHALANDETGALPGGPPLAGAAVEFARSLSGGAIAWDRAQISVVYPGYPRRGEDSEAAFDFRRRRDAAHIDGLLLIDGQRRLLEPQAFLLGLPLDETTPGASPLVAWEGSHRIMAEALGAVLRDHAPEHWAEIDLSETYRAARRQCFARCRRVELHARPGEACLLHRLTLHGIAPWAEGARAPPAGRMIAYFRPPLQDISIWPRL